VELSESSKKPVSRGAQLLLALFFIVGSFAVYGGILGHEFLYNWDDNVYITGNEAIRGFSLPHLRSAFSSFFVGNYAPLHIVSYMADYTLWGLNPRGYLLVNLLLHAVNAVLALRLFLLIDGRLPVALAAAILFLVHPVQVESVAWISERKTLLAMLFFLLSLHSYVRYSRETEKSRRLWYFLALLAYGAALLSKAVVVVLPLVLIAHDWLQGGKERSRKGLPDKIPFFALSAILTAVTLFSQRSADEISGYVGGSPLTSAMTMLPVFARYLGKIFWPVNLGPIYKPPIKLAPDGEVLLSMVLFGAIVSAALLLLHRRRIAGFALTLFLLGLLPVSHIFPIATLMQDRYLYFPLLGFALFLVALSTDALGALAGERGIRVWIGFLLLLALPLGVAAQRQSAIWRNPLTLWSHAAQSEPRSKQAWLLLAITLQDVKDFVGAEQAYLRLLAIAPRDSKGLNGIGILYGEKGDLDRSLDYLRRAVEVEPNNPETLVNFGYSAYLKGMLDESRDAFNRAVAISPGEIGRLLPTLLEIARRQGDRDEVARLEALMGAGRQR